MGNCCGDIINPNGPNKIDPKEQMYKEAYDISDTDNDDYDIDNDDDGGDGYTDSDNDFLITRADTMTYQVSSEQRNIIKKYINAILNKRFLDGMYLIEKYRNIDLMNYSFDNGNKSLHYGVLYKNSKFCIFLLQNGMSPNCLNNKNGNTPLHLSVLNDDIRMSSIMIKWKADISIKNFNGKTPVDIAQKRNDPDLVELLNDDLMQEYFEMNTPITYQYSIIKSKTFKNLYMREIKLTTPTASVEYNEKKMWDDVDDDITEDTNYEDPLCNILYYVRYIVFIWVW